jgi:hypothetical protein
MCFYFKNLNCQQSEDKFCIYLLKKLVLVWLKRGRELVFLVGLKLRVSTLLRNNILKSLSLLVITVVGYVKSILY